MHFGLRAQVCTCTAPEAPTPAPTTAAPTPAPTTAAPTPAPTSGTHFVNNNGGPPTQVGGGGGPRFVNNNPPGNTCAEHIHLPCKSLAPHQVLVAQCVSTTLFC